MPPTMLATIDDLAKFGPVPAAIQAFDVTTKEGHLAKASGLALSYVKKRYAPPLIEWGEDLRGAVVAIASWTLLCSRGANPNNAADVSAKERHDSAVLWLRDVARGLAELVDVVDSTTAPGVAAPMMASEGSLGWSWGTTYDGDS